VQNGQAGTPFNATVLPFRPHILTLCDATSVNREYGPLSMPCPSVVTHSDGSLVEASNPAQPGETVVMYAFGLGPTSQAVPAGTATPMALITTAVPYTLLMAYRGSGPASAPPLQGYAPAFAGLTPGQVGLYQVNFLVPAPSGPISDCGSPDGANLFVTLTSATPQPLFNNSVYGLDTAQICVAAATPARGSEAGLKAAR
jgi:uncharacterized protein (TIGR03437 family)